MMQKNFQHEGSEYESKSRSGIAEFFDWADSVVISVFCIILIFTFALRLVGVKGTSMTETLHNGDRLFITNLFYTPEAGDIVVVSRDYLTETVNGRAEPIIKRIIATEGQTVDLTDNADGTYSISVDGVIIPEDYVREPMERYYTKTVGFPYTVGEGHVFVMGDNRNNSRDSRSFDIGAIDVRYILGKAVFRIYPVTDFGLLH